MVDYIDRHRQVFGVESICAELPIAPSTYHDYKKRQPSDRARRDAVMMPMLMALFVANYRVYGARKLWIAARRAGHDIGRDQVARLMKALDIEGVTRRRKRVWTTRRDDSAGRSPDLVDRKFCATAPNQLWVTDLTYVPTWSGVAYVAFIVDAYSRMIVGWRCAGHMRTPMVIEALNMAAGTATVISMVSSLTPMPGANTPRFGGPNASPRSERNHRSEALVTHTTTRSPSR